MFQVGQPVEVRFHMAMYSGTILEITGSMAPYVVGFQYKGNFLRMEYTERELRSWNS